MARIIPGVQVTVVKEVVPPQLAPSGVLGLVGLVAPPRKGEDGNALPRKKVERVGSWGRFRDLYGRASAWAMPEAQQALQNGVFELVIVDLESTVASQPKCTFQLDGEDWLTFKFRTKGTSGNGLKLSLVAKKARKRFASLELIVKEGNDVVETHRNLSPLLGSPRWIGTVLEANDSLVEVAAPAYTLTDLSGGVGLDAKDDSVSIAAIGTIPVLTITKVTADGPTVSFITAAGKLTITENLLAEGGAIEIATAATDYLHQIQQAVSEIQGLAVDVVDASNEHSLASGADATEAEYVNAIDELVNVGDVDLVAASIQDLTNDSGATIYGAIIAHCENMSADAKGRIGFGQVPPNAKDEDSLELVESLVSDRFALFAPNGLQGAAIGRIGSLPYYHSPTFKPIAGLGEIEPALTVEQQRSLLKAKLAPIAQLPGRGNVVVRGITTDGDQINVRRVADRAVRGVKQIGELFIGKLNTEDGRNALKQKLNEFLLQMASENAIVPSTDGSDPAFKLDVYSTQADFAQGIVRVDLAVRPVRAIDFIYATVLVQV